MVCTVLFCGTGNQTFSFFVPAGTSETLPTYSMEDFREPDGFMNSGATFCWFGGSCAEIDGAALRSMAIKTILYNFIGKGDSAELCQNGVISSE